MAFMEGKEGVAVGPEQHEIGLPVAGGAPVRRFRRPLGQGAALGDEGSRTPAFGPPPPAFAFGLGQIVAPGIVFIWRAIWA